MVERPDELESERIQQDIERTRQQMSGTIDEIQERLTPSRLLHEATASVREAGAGSVRRVLSQAGAPPGARLVRRGPPPRPRLATRDHTRCRRLWCCLAWPSCWHGRSFTGGKARPP